MIELLWNLAVCYTVIVVCVKIVKIAFVLVSFFVSAVLAVAIDLWSKR